MKKIKDLFRISNDDEPQDFNDQPDKFDDDSDEDDNKKTVTEKIMNNPDNCRELSCESNEKNKIPEGIVKTPVFLLPVESNEINTNQTLTAESKEDENKIIKSTNVEEEIESLSKVEEENENVNKVEKEIEEKMEKAKERKALTISQDIEYEILRLQMEQEMKKKQQQ